MTEQTDWTLQKIREAYRDILRAWNILFPLYPNGRREKEEEVLDAFDPGKDKFYLEFFSKKAKRILPKLKRAADQSGGAQIWRRGDPLDGLNQGLRGRVEMALKLGI